MGLHRVQVFDRWGGVRSGARSLPFPPPGEPPPGSNVPSLLFQQPLTELRRPCDVESDSRFWGVPCVNVDCWLHEVKFDGYRTQMFDSDLTWPRLDNLAILAEHNLKVTVSCAHGKRAICNVNSVLLRTGQNCPRTMR